MLATLERPIERLADATSPTTRATAIPLVSPSAPPRLRLLAPPDSRSPTALPVLPGRVAAPGPVVVALPLGRLRMTMRARRLLAGLVLLCAALVGVVAVDVLSAIVPAGPGTSYAAQEEPYAVDGPADSGGLVPSSGAAITVGAGDTLWSLAEQVDPKSDPRDLIAAIMILNDLDSPTIVPGQVLQLP